MIMTTAIHLRPRSPHSYGEEITSTNNDTYKFAQTYRDSDSGLDYANARFYASSMGRFLNVDPNNQNSLQSPQSWNRYSYASGDPVNRFDPSGGCDVDSLSWERGQPGVDELFFQTPLCTT
jgi:RHS repeat-associated protein